MRSVLPLITLAALVGCQRPAATQVGGAWVRLAAAPGRPSGGYFTLTGGPTDRTLTGVTSTAAGRIELHETMNHGGTMTMTPSAQVPVPAGATIAFAPGGKHLMLFDVAPAMKPGARLPLTFAFADGKPLTAEATVIAAGDPAPAN